MKKKYIFTLLLTLLTFGVTFAQSTVEVINQQPRGMKPVIMVVPEKAWCLNNGYVRNDNSDAPDYEKALLNDDVLNVITRMGEAVRKPIRIANS